MKNLSEKANEFASLKHEGQKRKFEGTPYIQHPIMVATRTAEFTPDQEVIAAAFLHDVLEDTETVHQEIVQEFGERIANLVQELTSDDDLIMQLGKSEYLTKKINSMSAEARLIKLCDREHNVTFLHLAPEPFQTKYATSTAYILAHINFIPNLYEQEIISSIQEKIRPFI